MWPVFKAFIWISLAYGVVGHELPKGLQVCNLSNPNLDECLQKAVSGAISLIGAKGISSLGLPSVDPIFVKEYHIEGEGAASFSQHYYDCKVYGVGQVQISNVHMDLDNKILTLQSLMNASQEAHYKLSGRLLQLPITGDGYSKLQLDGTTIVHTIKFNEQKKNGEIYWVIEDYNLKITVTKASFQFENLFNGNKLLSENILKVMNDNWRDVVDGLIGPWEKAYGIVLKAIGNQVFGKIPFSKLFPK